MDMNDAHVYVTKNYYIPVYGIKEGRSPDRTGYETRHRGRTWTCGIPHPRCKELNSSVERISKSWI